MMTEYQESTRYLSYLAIFGLSDLCTHLEMVLKQQQTNHIYCLLTLWTLFLAGDAAYIYVNLNYF